MGDTLIEVDRGKFIVGYTDLHAGGDAVAVLRNPMALAVDMIEYPVEVQGLCERITSDFLEVYDFFTIVSALPTCRDQLGVRRTSYGRFHVLSSDFSCMISAPMFEEIFLPGIRRECRHMDRCIYHLDEQQALHHLEALLETPETDAIQ